MGAVRTNMSALEGLFLKIAEENQPNLGDDEQFLQELDRIKIEARDGGRRVGRHGSSGSRLALPRAGLPRARVPRLFPAPACSRRLPKPQAGSQASAASERHSRLRSEGSACERSMRCTMHALRRGRP